MMHKPNAWKCSKLTIPVEWFRGIILRMVAKAPSAKNEAEAARRLAKLLQRMEKNRLARQGKAEGANRKSDSE
jgi:hypothetical protein